MLELLKGKTVDLQIQTSSEFRNTNCLKICPEPGKNHVENITNCKNKEILFVHNTALSHSNCAESHLDSKNVINLVYIAVKFEKKLKIRKI